jgi:alpha-tubulin suppressor-like RCC1 family protein
VRIKSAAAGSNHDLALTETGEVFTWGKNFYGRLGLGTDDYWGPTSSVPELIKFFDEKVCVVEAGDNTSCAVTTIGKLFTWGKDAKISKAR